MDEKGLPGIEAVNHHRLKALRDITESDLKDFPIEEQPIPFHNCAIAASDLALAGTAIAGGALGFIIGVLAGDAGIVEHGVKVGTAIGTVVINPILVTLYWNYTN